MAKFSCTRCGGKYFFHENGSMYCHSCKGLYSNPSQGELKKMIEGGQIFDGGLIQHYEQVMLGFDAFVNKMAQPELNQYRSPTVEELYRQLPPKFRI